MYKALRKIVLAAIFALFLSGNSKAQTYVLIPDANFATYLQGLIPSAMSGNSLNITSTLVTTIQSLSPSNLNISDLTGVQYFTSLTYLACYNNNLSTLPTLPNSLTILYCNGSFLTSLPALPSTLTDLNCSWNNLTTLPPLTNSLTDLDCRENALTTLPTLPNSLTRLYCLNNSLTSLPSLPNSLTHLDCAWNNLTTLPPLPNSLTDLNSRSNSLTTLPALPNSLESLAFGFNSIKCFPVFPNSLYYISINPNPYNCLPNYVLPAMNAYTTTPLCVAGNTNGCAVIGINELKPNNIQITIYPNPSKGAFSLKIEDEINNGELILINSIGQIIYTSKIARGENKITSGITSSGLYQYIILQNKQPISRGKLVIE